MFFKRIQIVAAAVGVSFLMGAKVYPENKEVYVTFDSLKDLTAKNGGKIDGAVKFVFSKDRGNITTGNMDTGSGQTSGFSKDKEVACRWALLSALLKFQANAKNQRKNAVTDIETSGAGQSWSGDRNKMVCLAGGMIVRTRVHGRYN